MVRIPFAMVQTVEGCKMTHTNNHAISGKAPGAINTEGLEVDTTNDLNFATGQRPGKELATLRAQFALMGHTLQCNHRADDPHVTYWVSKWGQARAFSTLHDVRAFLVQIGGAK